MKNQIELTVYYDGLCKVCSKEIAHYKKQTGADLIDFVDITSMQFNAAQEGVDPVQVHQVMHARRKDGTLVTRVDAFIEIWKVIPKYRLLSKMADQSLIKYGLELGYSCFAALRPFLPRYKKLSDCQDSPYCEAKNV